jgi:uncharacterized RDD family membrane protein YckC
VAEPIQPAPQGVSQWGPLASFGDRVVAWFIDFGIMLVGYIAVAIVGLVFRVVSDTLGALVGGLGYLAMVAVIIYLYYIQGEEGGTPGKRITGLKVVRLVDGQVTGGGMGIVRQIAHAIDAMICYIGYLFPLWDPQRQTLADKIVGTVVLRDQRKESFGPELFQVPSNNAG